MDDKETKYYAGGILDALDGIKLELMYIRASKDVEKVKDAERKILTLAQIEDEIDRVAVLKKFLEEL